MSDFSIRFLTRPDCHLCAEAQPLVRWACRKAGVDFEEVDVDQYDDLLSQYGLRIPVVITDEGTLVAEGRIEDRRGLRRAIERLVRT